MSGSVVMEREMAGSEDKYDVVVVGAGMFGSSAAKYLCQTSPHLRVALIGLGEPEDRADTEVTTVNFQLLPGNCLVLNINCQLSIEFIDKTKHCQLRLHNFSHRVHHTSLSDLQITNV